MTNTSYSIQYESLLTNNIIDFDKTAEFYRYREPYADTFFPALRQRLRLTAQTSVLDIACGSGELAAGISPFVRNVVAIDSSSEMLGNARPENNIRYVPHDLSISPFFGGEQFDLVLIGRAIPYLPVSTLGPTLSNLNSDGRVVVCGSIFQSDTPWVGAYDALKNKYRAYKPEKGVFNGIAKLSQLDFQLVDRFSVVKDTSCTLEFIAGNLLSYPSCTQKILDNRDDFQRDLRASLGVYLSSGLLNGRLMSWANVFARPPG